MIATSFLILKVIVINSHGVDCSSLLHYQQKQVWNIAILNRKLKVNFITKIKSGRLLLPLGLYWHAWRLIIIFEVSSASYHTFIPGLEDHSRKSSVWDPIFFSLHLQIQENKQRIFTAYNSNVTNHFDWIPTNDKQHQLGLRMFSPQI
jgi:hypothetical protein